MWITCTKNQLSGTRESKQLHHHKGPPKRLMKETLFTIHRSAVEPMMIAKDRKAIFQAIHTMAVNQAVTSLKRNIGLGDPPPLINISEKELTRRERTTLAQLRSEHCRLIGSYKSRISKDAGLDVCADCGKTFTSNDSRLHVVEPPRGRSFIWQIGVNSSIQDRRQGSMAESGEIYSCV